MKRPAIVTQARTTSSRLPGKVLIEVAGKTLLEHHLDRLAASGLDVYVATTTNDADDPIVEIATAWGAHVTRGSEDDVLSRYATCIREHVLESVVRVTSDCPLVDGAVIRSGVEVFTQASDPDLYVANTLARTYPRGFDFEVFSAEALLEADRLATAPAHREHVTPFLYENNTGRVKLLNLPWPEDKSAYRITLDTEADLRVIRSLIEDHAALDKDCAGIIAVLDQHPEIALLNAHVEQKKLGEVKAASQRTLVVHAGTFKTGSTSIQRFLQDAEADGRMPPGTTYPAIGVPGGSVQHSNLAAELTGAETFHRATGSWADIVDLFGRGAATTVIVSSELFSTLGGAQLARLGEYAAMARARVRWVQYLREQPSAYNAFYVERLKVMRPEFLEVVKRPFEDFGEWSPIPLDFLRYATFARNVLDEVPRVDLRLRPFTRDHLRDGDVVADFCRTAELAIDPAGARPTNIGMGWRTVETARRLTPMIKQARMRARLRGTENPAALRLRWIALTRHELILASQDLGWNTESAVYLTPEFRGRLVADYRDENVAVGRLAGMDFAQIVESAEDSTYNIGDYATVTAEEVLYITDRVLPVLFTPPAEISAAIRRANRPPSASD